MQWQIQVIILEGPTLPFPFAHFFFSCPIFSPPLAHYPQPSILPISYLLDLIHPSVARLLNQKSSYKGL